MAAKTPGGSQDQQPAEQRGTADEAEAAPTNGASTSASGMSLQPPSLPSHFSQQRPQQALPAQSLAGSAQAQQATAGAVAAGAASPRDAGLQGLAGQKQAPKPPLAPGSKSLPQVLSHSTLMPPTLYPACF